MARPSRRPATVAAAGRWRLAVPRRRLAGRIGDRIGLGPGASIEFEDHRPYQPGDDPRHIDWRSYARSDRLDVRVYREEVAPAVDLVVDGSGSMAATAEKLRALQDLVSAARSWAGAEGGTLRVALAGGGWLDAERLPEPQGGATTLVPEVPLRPNGLRMLVSDFLTPRAPLPELLRIAARASHLFVVQLLDRQELEPSGTGPCTFVDVEDGTRLDLSLDERTITRYRERLEQLSAAVAAATRRVGGTFARLAAAAPDDLFRELARQSVLVPA